MTRILYMSGHSRGTMKWGLFAEIAKILTDNPENEVYYLDCDGKLNGFCGLNKSVHFGYCNKCYKKCLEILDYLNFPQDHILKMTKYPKVKFDDFNSIDEAIHYGIEGYNLGLGPISCIMTITKNYSFEIKKWNKLIKKFFETEYQILKNIEYYHKIYNFEQIHLFNGRMPSMYPYASFAKKHNIPFKLYELTDNIDRMIVVDNNFIHDFYVNKQILAQSWQEGGEDKYKIAKEWYEKRRKTPKADIFSYTKEQIQGLIPKNFDKTKENIAIFNSSLDEIMAYDSWAHPFAKNENEVFEAILKHYQNDENKHFYLRIHPNLKRAKKKHSAQIKEINGLKNKYKNLTVVEPEDKVDSYALMDVCDKVITGSSTTGAEATFWGNVAIVASKAIYEDTDCVYQAKSYEELFNLIDDKNLTPKPKENTYPLSYFYTASGEKYKYFKPKTQKEGEFFDLKFKG